MDWDGAEEKEGENEEGEEENWSSKPGGQRMRDGASGEAEVVGGGKLSGSTSSGGRLNLLM